MRARALQTRRAVVSRLAPAPRLAVARSRAVAPRAALGALILAVCSAALHGQPVVQEYAVPAGSHPHDVAPAPDGRIWYTAQSAGALGWLDPRNGRTDLISLGSGSRPHGVIVGPDGNAWVTDSGLNAIVRVAAATGAVTRFDLPRGTPNVDLNTAAFDKEGRLWFTGQRGYYGSLDPATGRSSVYPAPQGGGPYGIFAGRDGLVYYVSLSAGYLGRIDPSTGNASVLSPPTRGQGTRRVWADSKGMLWITGWYSGKLLRYDPARGGWQETAVPGSRPQPYAVYVDETDAVWISDFGTNALHRYDPSSGSFETLRLPSPNASVRQLHGRTGEVWGAESGADKLVVVRF